MVAEKNYTLQAIIVYHVLQEATIELPKVHLYKCIDGTEGGYAYELTILWWILKISHNSKLTDGQLDSDYGKSDRQTE